MVTRQEIQIARDLIKFTNVANDLFDEAVKIAKGQVSKPGIMGELEKPMTVEQIKQLLDRAMQNIENYDNLILTFLGDSAKKALAINGLSAWGVDVQSIIDDVQLFVNTVAQVRGAISSAINQTDLNTIADSIGGSITPLLLVRKTQINTG